MRRLLAILLLSTSVPRARAQATESVARAIPRLVIPGAPIGREEGAKIILTPGPPTLLIAPAPTLIVPDALKVLPPEPMIIAAKRPLTEAEAAPAKEPSKDDLAKLAESLTPSDRPRDSEKANAAASLAAAFDGKLAPEASDWHDLAPQFARGPLSPGLPAVETAARSLIARLLPNVYRRVPVTVVFDRGEVPVNGQSWTRETGHVIQFAPVRPNSRGEVPSSIGESKPLVQHKIEHLIAFAHEYFHVLFDASVRREDQYSPHSAYAAMTEGFATSVEQLLINRLIDSAPALALGPRDAEDLTAMSRARISYLELNDTKYSEGFISWRKAYKQGGTAALVKFLSTLSAPRMAAVPRSDPAYQLALGEPELLSGYLGRDETSPARLGLDAFGKAARGEKLAADETREASSAIEKAGAEGWRRVFWRTLIADKRLGAPGAPSDSVEPAFALARLSPSAGAELARFLTDLLSHPDGAGRLFGRPGPNERLNAIIVGADTLPWSEADRRAWDAALMKRLTGLR